MAAVLSLHRDGGRNQPGTGDNDGSASRPDFSWQRCKLLGAEISGPASFAFHTQRPIDDLVCFHAVPLRRSELRYAAADLATAQTEQDDLQQFHDAPSIPTDTSYTDLPGFSAMVEAREKLDTRGIADHETDGPPTVEAAAASEPPDGVAPASAVMPVMPQRHWVLLEHPQLQELGATE